jgi:hypothetical protein
MAYTKYSLTPADNNAAPPNGAPEGMLPSGVNDTMRDMMSQIRDVGDGIRGGTYTMTAPVITGGSVTGSTINNTPIGASTANTGAFTTLGATGNTNLDGGSFVFNDSGADKDFRIEGDTNANLFFTDASTDRIGIGTDSPAVLAHVQNTTATTNAVTQVLRLDSQSSGTPANGIGVGIEFATETAAANTEIGATIEAITTDVTSTSEDFDLSFKTMAAGAAAAERMRVKSTGDFQFNSGYGSVATAYGCRAWANFNGTGTVAIRESGNVSSITDNGTGDYTVNFTSAMPDADYSVCGITLSTSTGNETTSLMIDGVNTTYTTTQCRIITKRVNPTGGNFQDYATVCVSFFR